MFDKVVIYVSIKRIMLMYNVRFYKHSLYIGKDLSEISNTGKCNWENDRPPLRKSIINKQENHNNIQYRLQYGMREFQSNKE